MLNLKVGTVEKVIDIRNNALELLVRIEDNLENVIAYKMFIDDIRKGDKVLLNTTANDLKLGTGGYHFVVANLDNLTKSSKGYGHIMKLRYTPLQIKVNSCEEQKSEFHQIFNNFSSLKKMPVLVGSLHSMLTPLAVVLKSYNKDLKICYIMTDGGALPIDFSKTVYNLKKYKYIDSTITIGHAFGGDIECINVYNGLIAAKEVVKCDIVIITMGPGIAGTGTKYGFSGIEQGNVIDAVNDLDGIPICIPRISFKDKRKRHYGISHHTITVLRQISKTKSLVGIPKFEGFKFKFINEQLDKHDIKNKHDIHFLEFNDIIDMLKESNMYMSTMGRNLEEDLDYFVSVGVNAKIGLKLLIHN